MKPSLLLLDDEEAEGPSINLTPLIDVVFVILISFVVIAPMIDLESIRLASAGPLSKKESTALSKELTISIFADQTIHLKGKKVSLTELKTELMHIKKQSPHQIPKLIPDAACHFERYQQVKNILESLGFEQMDLIVKPSHAQ